MKVRFFQRLNTRLYLFPLFIMLVIFVAGGIGFYVFGYSHLLRDLHKLYLINLSSDKKLVIDSSFHHYKSDLKDLSRLGIFRDSVVILTTIDTQRLQRSRKDREAFDKAQITVSRLFGEKALTKGYDLLCLLSMDGRVVSSSRNDMVGADWSDRMFLKEVSSMPTSRDALVLGADNNIDFIMPVFDVGDNMIAVLYASSKADELIGFLKIRNVLYKSEKIELIDRKGNIVLTGEGASAKKIRYNIPGDSQNIVRYKDGIFFYVADLEQAPFRLIATVQESDVTRPFIMLLIVYLSFAVVVILLSVIQNAYLAKRLITRPLSRIVNAMKSVAAGDMNVDLGRDYKGEFLEIKRSFENMIGELRERESNLRENIRTKEQSRLRSMVFGKMSKELRDSLNTIVHGVEMVLERGSDISSDSRMILGEVSSNAKDLLQLMDDLLDLSLLEDGRLTISQEEFNIAMLLKEIKESAISLIGTKEIELIVECEDTLINKPVYTDRQRVRQILTNLITHALRSTEIGTVTVLSSVAMKNGVEHIEFSVADTGKGIEPEVIKKIFEGLPSSIRYIGLAMAKRLTDALGGRMDVESIPDKGSVFTVTIPIKATAYQ